MRHKLNCYASGDGALHFCWQRDGKASGRSVTVADAKRFLARKSETRLRERGWRVLVLDGVHPCLVADIKRMGPSTLLVEGKSYEYSIAPDSPFHEEKKWLPDQHLTLSTETAAGPCPDVKNVNVRAQVRHFLTHEAVITNPGWALAFGMMAAAGINKGW